MNSQDLKKRFESEPIDYTNAAKLAEDCWLFLTDDKLPARANIKKEAFLHEVGAMIESAILFNKPKPASSLPEDGEGWISVEDRLPEVPPPYHDEEWGGTVEPLSIRVLVWDGEDVYEEHYSKSFKDSGGHFDNNESNTITHWQPLPAPPGKPLPAVGKEDEQEKLWDEIKEDIRTADKSYVPLKLFVKWKKSFTLIKK